jgi:PST family polysaccharide transporter
MAHTLGGAFLNVGLNLALIPRFGASGAALATLISQAFTAVLFNGLARATWPILSMQMRSIFTLVGSRS